MTPHQADLLCLCFAAIVPIPIVFRLRWVGVALGTLVVWETLFIGGLWLAELDPQRGHSPLDTFWLLFGWVGGLMYCLPLLLIRERLVAYLNARRSADQEN